MEELIKKIMDGTDLDEKMAEKVVKIVAEFAKDKLPEPFGQQVSSMLEGQDISDIKGTLDGFLGGFKK